MQPKLKWKVLVTINDSLHRKQLKTRIKQVIVSPAVNSVKVQVVQPCSSTDTTTFGGKHCPKKKKKKKATQIKMKNTCWKLVNIITDNLLLKMKNTPPPPQKNLKNNNQNKTNKQTKNKTEKI